MVRAVARRVVRLIGTCRVAVCDLDLEVAAYTLAEPGETDGYTIPAFFRRFGKRVRGYVLMEEDSRVFVPHPDYVKYLK